MRVCRTIIILLISVAIGLFWVLTSPPRPLPPLKDEFNTRWTNNAGTSTCRVPYYINLHNPDTAKGVFSSTNEHKVPLCISGTGMSTSHICCNGNAKTDVMASMDLWGINNIDVRTRKVDVQCGILMDKLANELESKGLALDNQPSYLQQSLVGALQTASHGSMISKGTLSSSVISMDILLYNLTQITVSRKQYPNLFDAAIAGLGSFGYITDLSVRAVKGYQMHRSEYSIPFSDFSEAYMTQLLTEHQDWVMLQFSPFCDSISIKTADRIGKTFKNSTKYESVSNSLLSNYFYPRWATFRTRLIQPLLKLSAINPSYTPLVMKAVCPIIGMGTEYITSPSKAMELSRPNGAQTHMEYFIARTALPEALVAVRDTLLQAHEKGLIDFNGLITVSFVAKDDVPLLSPTYRYDSAAIEVTNYFSGENAKIANLVEAALSKYEPIPHPGLFHTLDAKTIQERYTRPRIEAWNRARYHTDPEDRFMNKWKKLYYMDVKPNKFFR